MLYEVAFTIHMIGLIGWGGVTTGAYWLVVLSGIREQRVLLVYRKLVYLEWASLLALAISGGYMWEMLGRPSWVYPAFYVAPILAVGEIYHWRLTYLTVEIFRKRMRFLSVFYTVIALFLIYDMVFKP